MCPPQCITAALSGRTGWICQLNAYKPKASQENRLGCIGTASHSAPFFSLRHTHTRAHTPTYTHLNFKLCHRERLAGLLEAETQLESTREKDIAERNTPLLLNRTNQVYKETDTQQHCLIHKYFTHTLHFASEPVFYFTFQHFYITGHGAQILWNLGLF